MNEITKTHADVLSAIREDGGRVGIAYYGLHSREYESLPQREAAKLWREIFLEIERKERLSRPSVLLENDPFISENPLDKTDDEIINDRKYRQTHWISDSCLNLEMANSMLRVYDNALKAFGEMESIPVYR